MGEFSISGLGRLIIRGGNHERDELSMISGTFYISHATVKVFYNEKSIIYTTL